MKILVDDVVRRLDKLIYILESREYGYGAWDLSEISRLKDIVIRAKKPVVPSRAVWEKYTILVTMLEEVLKLASKPGYEYALHSSLLSLRERITEFRGALETTYITEKVQVALPVVLGFLVAIIRGLSVGFNAAWPYLAVSIASLALVFLRPLLGLAGIGTLGALLIALETELSSIFTGALLIIVSATYIYLLILARSAKFEKKIKDAVKGVNQVLQALIPEQVKVDEVLSSLLETYSIDSTGIFNYLDRQELLRYKAGLLVALGLVPRNSAHHNNNKSHE